MGQYSIEFKDDLRDLSFLKLQGRIFREDSVRDYKNSDILSGKLTVAHTYQNSVRNFNFGFGNLIGVNSKSKIRNLNPHRLIEKESCFVKDDEKSINQFKSFLECVESNRLCFKSYGNGD